MQPAYSVLFGAIVLLQAAGCNDGRKLHNGAGSGEAVKTKAATETDSSQPPADSTDKAPDSRLADPLRGIVGETMASGGYTYILLATKGGREIWAAARKFSVAVGDEVEIAGLSPMRNFRSATLGRVFEEIYFVGQAKLIGGSATSPTGPAHAQAPALPPGHPPLGGEISVQPKLEKLFAPKAGQIEKLADGVTVAELFAKKAELTGKIVKFRGKVVKASRMILGSNWLHIQDGTGEPPSNDITVTSKADFAAVGSIVVIEGTLGVDKDFGAGYLYAVIVEDAKVVAEAPKSGAAPPHSGKAE